MLPSVRGKISMSSTGAVSRRREGDDEITVKLIYRLKEKETWYALSIDGSTALGVDHRETSYPSQEFFSNAHTLLWPELSQWLILYMLLESGIPRINAEIMLQQILNFVQFSARDAVGKRYNVLRIEVAIEISVKHLLNELQMVNIAIQALENAVEQMRGFGSVPVTPSAIAALKTRMFKKEAEDSDKNCMVCFEEFVEDTPVKQLPCLHIYHGECIVQWLRESNACPVCRFVVQDEALTLPAS